jgi:hypothetical protein
LQIIKTKQWRLELLGTPDEFQQMLDEFLLKLEGTEDSWLSFLTDTIQAMLSDKEKKG